MKDVKLFIAYALFALCFVGVCIWGITQDYKYGGNHYEEEIEEEGEKEEEYIFEKTGKLTAAIIEEYLAKMQIEVRAIDAFEKPFDENVLSDDRLGIPDVETEQP